MDESPPPPPRSPLTFALVGLTLAVGGVGVWYFYFRDDPLPPPTQPERVQSPPPPDPRLTHQTPFRNVHPSVKYVGDAACAACHADIDRCYHQHPMGRSAALAGKESPLERYDPAAFGTFQTRAHTLTVRPAAGNVQHLLAGNTPETAGLVYQTSVDVVIGSGTRGRSYLTVDRGSVWQSAISWFTDDARWNVSPGFELGEGGRRAITPDCLFCHVDRTDPVPGSKNRYRQVLVGQANVGCERCHGPGERHVEFHLSGGTPTGRDGTIVNPKHLSPQLQMDLCRQCHLLGEQRVVRPGRELSEYRPGLPLDLFLSVYVRPPDRADGQRSVGQFEQMERSACFTRSGAMTCTTCHDPHQAPAKAEVAAFYRGKCLTCHDQKGCSQPEPVRQTKADSCVACHMPRRGSTSIAHAAVTDHRIPRHADAPPRAAPSAARLPSDLPIVPYRRGAHTTPEDQDRDWGVALAQHLPKLAAKPAESRAAADAAVEKLTQAVTRDPSDAAAWHRLATAFGERKDVERRVQAVRRAAELALDSEPVLSALAKAEASVRAYPEALAATGRLIRLNPAAVEHRLLRASVLLMTHDWAGAEAECRDALAVNPLSAEAHVLRSMALSGLGKADEARKAADAGLALETNPEVQNRYRGWLNLRR
jgi:predicted CXXCH cytochrome family protein